MQRSKHEDYIKGRIRIQGFTLIELSIVLVVIGLLVGGVLTGQDMIRAAEVRAQVTQIEKYNSAVNTFKSKFNAIPGDMTTATAQQFGFTVGNGCNGQVGGRDGNALIDGWPYAQGTQQAAGETGLFWQDLSGSAGGNLIEGQYPNSGSAAITCAPPGFTMTGTGFGAYMPSAKIGRGNYVAVYETSGFNWYSVAAYTSANTNGYIFSANNNISVLQAYNIDKKIDDGMPVTGNVQATALGFYNNAPAPAPNTTTSGGTSSSCYDTTTSTYSTTYGTYGNCALSFKMQGAQP